MTFPTVTLFVRLIRNSEKRTGGLDARDKRSDDITRGLGGGLCEAPTTLALQALAGLCLTRIARQCRRL